LSRQSARRGRRRPAFLLGCRDLAASSGALGRMGSAKDGGSQVARSQGRRRVRRVTWWPSARLRRKLGATASPSSSGFP